MNFLRTSWQHLDKIPSSNSSTWQKVSREIHWTTSWQVVQRFSRKILTSSWQHLENLTTSSHLTSWQVVQRFSKSFLMSDKQLVKNFLRTSWQEVQVLRDKIPSSDKQVVHLEYESTTCCQHSKSFSRVTRDKGSREVTGGLVGLEQELFLCTHLSFNKLIILIKLVAVRSKYLAKTGLAVLDVLVL